MKEFKKTIGRIALPMLALLLGAGRVDNAIADSVSLQWTGTVVSVEARSNPSFNIPLALETGENLFLRTTFKSAFFPTGSKVSGDFASPGKILTQAPVFLSISINGLSSLTDSEARLVARHDPPGGPIRTGPRLAESLQFFGAGQIQDFSLFRWEAVAGFTNLGDLLDGGETFDELDLWNNMPSRVLEFKLGSIDKPGYYEVIVDLSPVNAVPEAKASLLLLLLSITSYMSKKR